MKIAVPDFITNSYFPAVAAVELEFFKEEGMDMELEHIFPVNKACEVMRDGGIDFVAGAAHAPVRSSRTFSFAATAAMASSDISGAMITSTNCRSTIAAAVAPSSSRLNAIIPPNADSVSV